MSGSLRTGVTVVATAVIAVPVLALAFFAAVFLRTEAMRFDAAPFKFRQLCGSAWGTADKIALFDKTPETEWHQFATRGCSENTNTAYSLPQDVTDIPVAGVADDNKVITCEARLTSAAVVPDLSFWPFSDPARIPYTWRLENGPDSSYDVTNDVMGQRARILEAQGTFNHQVPALAGGALLLIALVAAAVWLATGRVLRPVEAIRREVADITAHDLTRRVPVPLARNEIAGLATTMNATLDRLETAVEDNRRFVADASHKLRSPIAALRAELEIAHAHPDLTDWRTVVDNALRDTYRLQRLATDLLLLARLDHTPVTAAADTVDLAELVREETSRHRSRHNVVTDLDGRPAPVRGSRALLARLLGNLPDNAERHATGHITVRLTTTARDTTLDVVDDGPGIPAEHRERVFARFTRLDHARARDTGGTGLGLPVARRVAAIHHGTLHAVDHDGGAHLTAILPLVTATQEG